MIDRLEPGATVLSPSGQALTVSAELAAEFQPGDSLVANGRVGLLRIPVAERRVATAAVERCAAAFDAMDAVADTQIQAFFHSFAEALADPVVWAAIERTNAIDVEAARARGRSTTRLAVSAGMRQNMIDGLRGWAATPSRRDAVLERVEHAEFQVELVGAALGVVAFVFEGRPNVLADACGVLRGGNTAIFRIGSDALATAREIMARAVVPALRATGLPEHAVTLIDSPAHAAGWSLFLDERVALAVARGSGPAVDLLGSLAQSAGTPVSLHGTGGAWMMAAASAATDAFAAAVQRSLDRKVCNTLNVCCIVRGAAATQVPAFLGALRAAGEQRGHPFKLHVVQDSAAYVPEELFAHQVQVRRADGDVCEPQAELLPAAELGTEWEWEESPEVTLVVVDSVDAAVDLFNTYSPRLVASLLTLDEAERARFYARVRSPFVGDDHTRWVDGQYALAKPELGLSNWAHGRLFGRGAILTGDSVFTVRTRYVSLP